VVAPELSAQASVAHVLALFEAHARSDVHVRLTSHALSRALTRSHALSLPRAFSSLRA